MDITDERPFIIRCRLSSVGSASSINVFQLSGPHGLVTIDSDQSGGTVFGDGFTFVAVGTDSSDGVPADVTFNDQ